MTPLVYLQSRMTETTKYLTAVADWFVMNGGDVVFDINESDTVPDDEWFDCERPSWLMPVIHEVRVGEPPDELLIYIGDTVESFRVEAIVDVGVVLRTGIPLPLEVVEASVGELKAAVPGFVTVDVLDGGGFDGDDAGIAVWLATDLDRDEIDSGAYIEKIETLLALADGSEAREVRCG